MLRVLDPTYTFRIELRDKMQQPHPQNIQAPSTFRPNKFYDGLNGKTGCDEALAAIKDALSKAGLECNVILDRFEYK